MARSAENGLVSPPLTPPPGPPVPSVHGGQQTRWGGGGGAEPGIPSESPPANTGGSHLWSHRGLGAEPRGRALRGTGPRSGNSGWLLPSPPAQGKMWPIFWNVSLGSTRDPPHHLSLITCSRAPLEGTTSAPLPHESPDLPGSPPPSSPGVSPLPMWSGGFPPMEPLRSDMWNAPAEREPQPRTHNRRGRQKHQQS